jgi:hypothetical protein
MSAPQYSGDIRDRFDELYDTAASFVRLPNLDACGGAHVRFNLDLDERRSSDQFRVLCYAYEDSYDWSLLPLVFDRELPQGVMRWHRGIHVLRELPMESALLQFDEQCRSVLEANEN